MLVILKDNLNDVEKNTFLFMVLEGVFCTFYRDYTGNHKGFKKRATSNVVRIREMEKKSLY